MNEENEAKFMALKNLYSEVSYELDRREGQRD
jgi:hypothetical protein